VYRLHVFKNYAIYDSAQKVERDVFKTKASPEDLMVFSFYPTKPVGSCDGGMIVSDDREKIDWFRRAVMGGSTFSSKSWNRELMFPGWKMNMNSIQAHIAQKNLRKLDAKNERLTEVRQMYNKEFQRDNQSGHLYRINVQDRDDFIKLMRERRIACGIHYTPCHSHPVYNAYKEGWSDPCKKSNEDSKTTVSIPFHDNLSDLKVEYIIEQIRKARRVLKAVR
jgi:dTDP-4-amino-4,6-dideoxygalactose transaminase